MLNIMAKMSTDTNFYHKKCDLKENPQNSQKVFPGDKLPSWHYIEFSFTLLSIFGPNVEFYAYYG